MIDPTSFRLRSFLAITIGAVLAAAALRHVLHVYVGISREEIRWDALIFVVIWVVAILLFRKAFKN